VAEDVLDERLDILLADKSKEMDVAFLNSKGFGGNNSTATVLSPRVVENMIRKRIGDSDYDAYEKKRETVRVKAQDYDRKALQGDLSVIYNFGTGIIEDHEIVIDKDGVQIDQFANKIPLAFDNPYSDMV